MTPVVWHTVFEVLAYSAGFQTYLWQRRRGVDGSVHDRDLMAVVAVGAIVGAALGAKMSYWLDDPLTAFAHFPDWRHLLEGKSIIGALLGGLLGVEVVKRFWGVRQSTGDNFVLPLTVGMCIGRIGCFLGGLGDHTYGIATTLPWGVDFGDGIARHPTQLYEIVFLLAQYAWIRARWHRFTLPGDRFRAFMIGYLAFRLLVEFIKPVFYIWPLGLTGLQWLCVAGLLYYARAVPRIVQTMVMGRKATWARR
ncbi:prolipoprotein diacylglyceryl transferase [Oleiagrimonas citrea]|uniref:Prolipoprotein diacylglyceryl transferase n=1 Tax=Oleiagrimonas citrea TaxID=1665687 RepID=A0A846ZP80_9GAMM|nr:prolipoprotein diacylglyceryl transferase family protein [Oleiagrimonas citrea]NKZ39263.1 prolipoprotein diacylglyceryl transferase [Oleiagrimonas citrea]